MITSALANIRFRSLLTLALLVVLVSSAVWNLSQVIRGLSSLALVNISSLGILAGWLLAVSQLKGRWSALLAFSVGLIGSLYFRGGMAQPFNNLSLAWLDLYGTTWSWRVATSLPGEAVISAWLDLISQASDLFTQVSFWINGLSRSREAYDPLVVPLVWGMIVWIVSTWAAWITRRLHQPLLGVLPTGILLAGVLNLTGGDRVGLFPLVGSTLLLMTLVRDEENENRWLKNRTDFPEGMELETTAWSLVLIVVVLVMAGTAAFIQSGSLQEMIDRWFETRRSFLVEGGNVTDWLGLEQQSQPDREIHPTLKAAGLPREHLLGSGEELSREMVMTVRVLQGGHKPLPPGILVPPEAMPAPQYYWRALTYADYSGEGWIADEVSQETYRAGDAIHYDRMPSQRMLHFEVERRQEGDEMLYTAGRLVGADHAFSVSWRLPLSDEEESLPEKDTFGATIRTSIYQAISLVSEPGITQLLNASEDYPSWIVARYLTLPDTLPPRVIELAERLVLSLESPYERALAIEAYLRSIPYTLDIPAPPPDRDVTDFFLFTLEKGYCDYYATAMVVLARAAGLPARLVVGYAGGSYDIANDRYLITQADAHSWVEIYFPGEGWVEFEPTGNRSTFMRREGVIYDLDQEVAFISQTPGLTLLNLGKILTWSVLALVTIASLVFIAGWWRLLILSPAAAISAIYRKLYHLGRPVVGSSPKGETPQEFALGLKGILSARFEGSFLAPLLGSATPELYLLLNLYQQALFSPHLPDKGERSLAILSWLRLSWRLRLVRIARHVIRQRA